MSVTITRHASARSRTYWGRGTGVSIDTQGTPGLSDRYKMLTQVKASLSKKRVTVGEPGRCRFCHRSSETSFRKVAHTIPEALGNKWIVSLDECDACNELFSKYEGALADAVAPLLTLGGVRGKGGTVRQTGRTLGNAVLTRTSGGALPHISARANGFDAAELAGIDPSTGHLRLKMPIAGVPFRPRHAYKALCKIAYAILPEAEILNYERLRLWLQDPADTIDFPFLDVALSFGAVGNAPALAVATLLRRVDPDDQIPHLLFFLCAGSVCLQIDLMSDRLEDHLPPVPMGTINIRWNNILVDDQGRGPIRIAYGQPVHLNWSGYATEPQPIEFVELDFDMQTTAAKFIPIMRQLPPAV